jgi:hypothetical protein
VLRASQRNQDATVYCGNLDEQVNDELLWELMIQVRALSRCTRRMLARRSPVYICRVAALREHLG